MKRLRPHLTYPNIGVTVCLLIVTLALTPLGSVSANAADDLSAQVAKALKKSKAADKRSKEALKTAEDALAQGGPVGPQGPPGPNGSPDTAAQVLTKVLTVDGPGSTLDADTIDGLDSAAFAKSASFRVGYVDAAGALQNSTPGVTAVRNSAGDYRLDFGDLNNACAVTVSVENTFRLVRTVYVGSVEGWDVEIADTTGTKVDEDFDFIAVCRTSITNPARPGSR